MSKGLTIIIPCYNCEKTLGEAFKSCFRQGLDNFEIVMVDDASTDGTKAAMKALAENHGNVKTVFHDKNKGGGAARNTAVAHASYDAIFCLDSDDILPDGTLPRMLAMLNEKSCDGIGLSRSVKFRGTDLSDIAFVSDFGYVNERIPIESLVEKPGKPLCPLYSVFMFTKDAFKTAGGYPTDHGFDTQGFAWRFLGNGLVAYGCPDTTYLHRVEMHESYYIREDMSGRTNANWRMILEEFLFLLSPKAQEIVLGSERLSYGENLMDKVAELDQPFATDATSLACRDSRKTYATSKEVNAEWLRLYKLEQNDPGTFHTVQKQRRDKFSEPSHKSLRGIVLRIVRKVSRVKKLILDILSARSYRPDLVAAYLWLKIHTALKVGFDQAVEPKKGTVDVVVPTVAKDFGLIKSSIASLALMDHNVGSVYIIAPRSNEIETFCVENKYTYVDEDALLPGVRNRIHHIINGIDLRGWIFQQLLKYSATDIVKTGKFIVLDSDTILLRPHAFIQDEKHVFFQSTEWNQEYFKSFYSIFTEKAPHRTSLVSHMMLFDVVRLTEMKREIESIHGKIWHDSILSAIDLSKHSCFSEYETYANWIALRYPQDSMRLPSYNAPMPRSALRPEEALRRDMPHKKSVSFHSHINS
ncbi:MAG: DUF6492 family protein [bacterium]|nr:DUF6492 family protein [bacterium]